MICRFELRSCVPSLNKVTKPKIYLQKLKLTNLKNFHRLPFCKYILSFIWTRILLSLEVNDLLNIYFYSFGKLTEQTNLSLSRTLPPLNSISQVIVDFCHVHTFKILIKIKTLFPFNSHKPQIPLIRASYNSL